MKKYCSNKEINTKNRTYAAILSVVLLATVIFGVSIGEAMASGSEAESCDFQYDILDEKVRILSYTGVDTDVIIPDVIDGVEVGFIAGQVFMRNTSLTSITMPETIIGIGVAAFYGCTSLTSVTIGQHTFVSGSDLDGAITSGQIDLIVGGAAFVNCGNF